MDESSLSFIKRLPQVLCEEPKVYVQMVGQLGTLVSSGWMLPQQPAPVTHI